MNTQSILSSATVLAVTASQESTILGIILLLLILMSFVVSGAKVAYFALDTKDLDILKTKQNPSYRRIIELLDNSQVFYVSLEIAQYFLYLAIIIVGSFVTDGLLAAYNLDPRLVVSIKIAVLILTFCLVTELLPKIFAYQNPIRFAKDFGLISQGFYYLFGRSARWLIKSSDNFENILFKKKSLIQHYEEELDDAIDNFSERASSEEEKNILKGIVKFSAIRAKQIMRPRLDVAGIESTSTFSQLIACINEMNYSRLPVYKGNLDNIEGIIYTKDIVPYINESADFDWHTLMRQPNFIHENKLIEELLYDFQQTHRHFAIVVDEFGGTSGIVTIEDVQEEIIGEIKDEFDEDDSKFKKLDDRNYIFEGKITLIEMCRIIGLPTDTFNQIKGDSDSLAGLMLELAKVIPSENQVITSGDFQFTVLEITHNRLEKIKVSIILQQPKE